MKRNILVKFLQPTRLKKRSPPLLTRGPFIVTYVVTLSPQMIHRIGYYWVIPIFTIFDSDIPIFALLFSDIPIFGNIFSDIPIFALIFSDIPIFDPPIAPPQVGATTGKKLHLSGVRITCTCTNF